MGLDRRTRIKAQLRQLGYTQTELAESLGYSRSRVAAVLNGARDSRHLMNVMEEQLKQWEAETKCKRQWK